MRLCPTDNPAIPTLQFPFPWYRRQHSLHNVRLKQPLRITGDLDMQGGVLDGGSASLWVNGAVRVNGGMLITPRAVMRVNSLDIQAPGVVRMGSRGKLNLAGNGTPLSGNGLLDVATNRPDSVEFTGKTTSSLDLAGPVSAL